MAIRSRNTVTPWAALASSGVAALLTACLLSGSGANFTEAQPAPAVSDRAAQMVVPTAAAAAGSWPPPDPGWEEQMESIIQQVANKTSLSSFAQIFSNHFKTQQVFIDRNATILIPTNVGYWRYETRWDILEPR
ncbi:unnamed protein product [Closterium sp. Naga37s-1]|nr:unnamed protein product [Closterium sp. Naga37s-1]